MLGKVEDRRRRGWKRMRWLDGITDSMDVAWVNSRSWWWTGRPGAVHAVEKNWKGLSNWTELKDNKISQKKRIERNPLFPTYHPSASYLSIFLPHISISVSLSVYLKGFLPHISISVSLSVYLKGFLPHISISVSLSVYLKGFPCVIRKTGKSKS